MDSGPLLTVCPRLSQISLNPCGLLWVHNLVSRPTTRIIIMRQRNRTRKLVVVVAVRCFHWSHLLVGPSSLLSYPPPQPMSSSFDKLHQLLVPPIDNNSLAYCFVEWVLVVFIVVVRKYVPFPSMSCEWHLLVDCKFY